MKLLEVDFRRLPDILLSFDSFPALDILAVADTLTPDHFVADTFSPDDLDADTFTADDLDDESLVEVLLDLVVCSPVNLCLGVELCLLEL